MVTPMSGTEHLTVERVGHTLVVTMNRPEAKNALSQPMLAGMYDAWVELNTDDDLRCAILTGGGGNFCTGMDLKAAAAGGGAQTDHAARWKDDPDLHWKALLRHYRVDKPLIAAVEGYAVAGGTEILQATHIRVAGRSATFGVFEAKRGLFPVGGSTVRLQRQIGYAAAMEMLLSVSSGHRSGLKETEEVSGVVTLEAPHGLSLGLAFGDPAGNVLLGRLVVLRPREDHRVQCPVQLAIAAA